MKYRDRLPGLGNSGIVEESVTASPRLFFGENAQLLADDEEDGLPFSVRVLGASYHEFLG